MNIRSILAMAVLVAGGAASSSAMAVQCGALTVPDAFATAALDSVAKGTSIKISDRKRLVVNGVVSVTGTNCNLRAKVNVTLKRKIRRDAHGSVIVKGTLAVKGGKMCITNTSVADVDLSNTLNIGEGVYKIVANKVMPNNFCF